MTVYVIEAWTPGPADGAWQPINGIEPAPDRDLAFAAMLAVIREDPEPYRADDDRNWRRLRVVAR